MYGSGFTDGECVCAYVYGHVCISSRVLMCVRVFKYVCVRGYVCIGVRRVCVFAFARAPGVVINLSTYKNS